jgi:uncharacterized protein (TIGR03437 family)
MCNLTLSAAAVSDSQAFSLSSSSQSLRLPAQLSARTGRTRIRFEATVDNEATQGSVIIEVRLGDRTVQEHLAILAPGMPKLVVPDHVVSRSGSEVNFRVVAADGQNLPLTASVSGQPASAVFDAQTGVFAWLPTESDLGRHRITFAATNAVGVTTSKTTILDVGLGHPFITSLQNGAGGSASPVCSPGSVATLEGRFLSSGGSDPTKVLVNGSEVPVLSAGSDRVDFVCPSVAPGMSLDIGVKTRSGSSNSIRTKMRDAAPGIFTVDGSGSGQAFAWRTESADLAFVPNFKSQGKPAAPGDKLSILATGIDCDGNSDKAKALLNLGNVSVTVDSLTPSDRMAGACEIGVTVPEGLTGDAVPLILDVTRSDGRILSSNTASIAIENEH